MKKLIVIILLLSISVFGGSQFPQIQPGVGVGNLSADPSSGRAGDFYFNNSSNAFRGYNGSAWGALGGASAWGAITGTLSNQTDLWTALGLLAPIANPTFTGTVTGTFSGNLTGSVTGTASNATNAATVSIGTNASFFPLFVPSSSNSNQAFNLGTGLTFNPSSNTLTTTTFSGALSGNASTVTTNANLSGPVTSTGNTTAIANGAITNAMLANSAVANLSGTNSGDVTIATFGSSPTANAATLSTQALTLQPADGTHPGSIAIAAQTMGSGIKTFSSNPVFSAMSTGGVLLNDTSGNITSSAGALAIAKGGTAVASVTVAPAATTFAGWDANKNFTSNAFIPGFTTTATAGGTTTMTIASTQSQVWTGTLAQTIKLPTTTVAQGAQYYFQNLSSGSITIQSSGANAILVMTGTTQSLCTAQIATPTTAANWVCAYASLSSTLPLTSPLTTKGDIHTFSTVDTRQAVPVDYGEVIADSNQTTGLRSASYTQLSGPKNYIQYKDLENGATTGWTKGNIPTITNGLPASNSPTFGSGSNANLTLSVNVASNVGGVNSLSLAFSSASIAGDMVASSAYTIDPADQAKVMTVKFSYRALANQTSANYSATSSNSFAWAVWDATNSVWLGTAGQFCINQNTGVGTCTGTFQTGNTTASLRLVIYDANATSGSITFLFDDFYLGPQTAPVGAPVTDWNSNLTFSPSAGFGTVMATDYRWKRVGDTMFVEGTFTPGTVAASTAYIQLPSGYTIDTTKLTSGVNLAGRGIYWSHVSGQGYGANNFLGSVFYDGSTNNQLFFTGQADTLTRFQKENGSTSFVSSSSVSFQFSIPITGWSSNVQMSNDTDTRVVAAIVDLTGNTAVTVGNPIIFNNIIKDTHGAYNSGTGQYVVPISGLYLVGVATANTSGTCGYIAYVNGSSRRYITSGNSTTEGGGSVLISVNAGDAITIVVDTNCTPQGTIANLSISRLSGPSAIAATETTSMRAHASATSISGSLTTVNFTTVDWDDHGGYSAGTYTCPVSGKYQANAALDIGGTFALNTQVDLQLQQNGSVVTEDLVFAGGVVTDENVAVSDMIRCLAGDTIRIQVSSGSTLPTIISSNSKNWFSLVRVGNY